MTAAFHSKSERQQFIHKICICTDMYAGDKHTLKYNIYTRLIMLIMVLFAFHTH